MIIDKNGGFTLNQIEKPFYLKGFIETDKTDNSIKFTFKKSCDGDYQANCVEIKNGDGGIFSHSIKTTE